MEIRIMNGDIADMCADAIVIPTNERLKEGSGCSQALFERAGRSSLQRICEEYINQNGSLSFGDVIETTALNLHAEHLFHAVVPYWVDGKSNECQTLKKTYSNILYQADSFCCKSIAIPLLASGNNGFDLDLAFRIAMETIESYEERNSLNTILFVIYGDRANKLIENIGFNNYMMGEDDISIKNEHFVLEKLETIIVIVEALGRVYKTLKKFDQEHPECRVMIKRAGHVLQNKYGLDRILMAK